MILTVTLNPALDHTVELPRLNRGSDQPVRRISLRPAGKGLNVARMLAGLGVADIAVTGFVGRSEARLFESCAWSLGMESEFIKVDGRTRINTTVIETEPATDTHLKEPGFSVDDEKLEELERFLAECLAAGDVAVFSGSMPEGVGGGGFVRLLRAARESGATVAVDTGGAALAASISLPPDVIKPNEAELAELAGKPGRQQGRAGIERAVEAARDVRARGVGVVLATLGAAGAVLVKEDWSAFASCKYAEGKARSTVGAGDAALAGYLYANLEGKAPETRLRAAVALASAKVTCEPGTDPNIAMFESYLSKTTVTAL